MSIGSAVSSNTTNNISNFSITNEPKSKDKKCKIYSLFKMIFLPKTLIQWLVMEVEFVILRRRTIPIREKIQKKNKNFRRIMEQVSTTTKIIHSTDQEISTISQG